MALKNDMPAILGALKGIKEAKRVTREWPKSADEAFPCLVVTEAGNTPAAFADDRIHTDELTYDVRVFVIKAADKDTLAPLVDAVMETLRYRRTLVYDDDRTDVRMKVMRYKRIA